MITKSLMNELAALAHNAQDAAETLSERIEVAAESGGVSKAALRRVVMAYANGKVEKLEREALAISQMIGQQDLLDDLSDGTMTINTTRSMPS